MMWGVPHDPFPQPPPDFEFSDDRRRYADARAVVFHLPAWKWRRWLGMPQKLPGQLGVAWTIESDVNHPYQHDPKFMRRFDLTMTYHHDSHVPLMYFEYYSDARNLAQALRRAPLPKQSEPLAVAFISSRFNASGRLDYLRELMRHLPIDSYGKFMRNQRIANDTWRPSKLETIARYKFTLAFENARDHDYVTEKFYDPLVAGSVPVYLGAPNVEQFAPGEHCFINVTDFPNPRTLAAYLQDLAHDEAAYHAYFAWKQKEFRASFNARIERSERHPFVRLGHVIASLDAAQ